MMKDPPRHPVFQLIMASMFYLGSATYSGNQGHLSTIFAIKQTRFLLGSFLPGGIDEQI